MMFDLVSSQRVAVSKDAQERGPSSHSDHSEVITQREPHDVQIISFPNEHNFNKELVCPQLMIFM